MTLKIKFSMRPYKRFNSDIWHLSLLGWPETNVDKYKRASFFFQHTFLYWLKRKKESLKRFIFRTDIIEPERRRRKVNFKFASLRIVRLFYLTLKYKQFKHMARRARKKDGYFGHHYCLALEGRLISFVYRTGFVENMFEALYMVKHFFVIFNKKIINYPNHPTGLFKILSFHKTIKNKIYFDLYTRLRYHKKAIFNPATFFFISFWFLFAYIHSYPAEDYFILPKSIDIYRASGYAH